MVRHLRNDAPKQHTDRRQTNSRVNSSTLRLRQAVNHILRHPLLLLRTSSNSNRSTILRPRVANSSTMRRPQIIRSNNISSSTFRRLEVPLLSTSLSHRNSPSNLSRHNSSFLKKVP